MLLIFIYLCLFYLQGVNRLLEIWNIIYYRISLCPILILCHLALSDILMLEVAFKASCLFSVAIVDNSVYSGLIFHDAFTKYCVTLFFLIMCLFYVYKICSLALTCVHLNILCLYFCLIFFSRSCTSFTLEFSNMELFTSFSNLKF